MLYLICYDVTSPRRRHKLANVLLDHGTRVQRSAYECDLKTEARLWEMLALARTHVDPKTDTLRAYRVCAACRGESRAVGVDHARPVPATIIL